MVVIEIKVMDQEKKILKDMVGFNNSTTSVMVKRIVFDYFEDV